jgi:hypothetical protein
MKAYTTSLQVHAKLELGSCHGTTTLPTLHHYLATITPILSSYKSFTIPPTIKATPQNLPSNLHTTNGGSYNSMTLNLSFMG